VDVNATNSDEALKLALSELKRMKGDFGARSYSDATIEEHPVGASSIAVRFSYTEDRGKGGCQYLSIYANNEEEAVKWFNANLKGKHFYQPWPAKINDNGNCIYDKVEETYFAVGQSDFDATVSIYIK
jgi:hypothetical protein